MKGWKLYDFSGNQAELRRGDRRKGDDTEDELYVGYDENSKKLKIDYNSLLVKDQYKDIDEDDWREEQQSSTISNIKTEEQVFSEIKKFVSRF